MNAFLKEEFVALEQTRHQAQVTNTAHALHLHELLDILLNRRFGVEYQPLVDTRSGETIDFEALSRFYRANGEAVAPDSVFNHLHSNPLLLFHAEMEMKKLQILHAPETGMLFLNLDPDSFHAGQASGGNVFTNLFRCRQRLGREILVEIIENLHIGDVMLARALITDLQDAGIRVAMDDLGVSNGLVSFAAFYDSAFIKFDRFWLAECTDRKLSVMKWFHGMARATGGCTVLEGIETPADLAIARDIGFDYVQGFYFRDRFITHA